MEFSYVQRIHQIKKEFILSNRRTFLTTKSSTFEESEIESSTTFEESPLLLKGNSCCFVEEEKEIFNIEIESPTSNSSTVCDELELTTRSSSNSIF